MVKGKLLTQKVIQKSPQLFRLETGLIRTLFVNLYIFGIKNCKTYLQVSAFQGLLKN